MEKTLQFLQKLLKCMGQINLDVIKDDRQALLAFMQKSNDSILSYIFERDNTAWQRLFQFPMRPDTIYECLVMGGVTFFIYRDTVDHHIYFLGPVLTKPFSDTDATRILEQYRIPQNLRTHILNYCGDLPVVPIHTLYRIADLVVQHLTGREEAFKFVQIDTMAAANTYMGSSASYTDENVMLMRQTEKRYEFSIALTEAVKQGNLSMALYLMGNFAPDKYNPVRNPNPLRNAQNYCIILNTQLRHALEESGIHPFRLDKLSNDVGMQIERLTSPAQIEEFVPKVVRQYCHLVQEYNYPNLRPLTHLAVAYIKDHLAENLSVKETAKSLSVNANYLSSLFHADLGVTFIDFINQERVNQAAALLKHTRLQIQQIAALVGYNNTSYFARQFKRVFDQTPQAYRAHTP